IRIGAIFDQRRIQAGEKVSARVVTGDLRVEFHGAQQYQTDPQWSETAWPARNALNPNSSESFANNPTRWRGCWTAAALMRKPSAKRSAPSNRATWSSRGVEARTTPPVMRTISSVSGTDWSRLSQARRW